MCSGQGRYVVLTCAAHGSALHSGIGMPRLRNGLSLLVCQGAIHESINALDMRGMAAIASGSAQQFEEYLRETGNTICGRHAIAVLLQVGSLGGARSEYVVGRLANRFPLSSPAEIFIPLAPTPHRHWPLLISRSRSPSTSTTSHRRAHNRRTPASVTLQASSAPRPDARLLVPQDVELLSAAVLQLSLCGPLIQAHMILDLSHTVPP